MRACHRRKARLACRRPNVCGAPACARAAPPPRARFRGSAFACSPRRGRSAPRRACCSRNTSTFGGRRAREGKAKAPPPGRWPQATPCSSRHRHQRKNAERSGSSCSAARGPRSIWLWRSASRLPPGMPDTVAGDGLAQQSHKAGCLFNALNRYWLAAWLWLRFPRPWRRQGSRPPGRLARRWPPHAPRRSAGLPRSFGRAPTMRAP